NRAGVDGRGELGVTHGTEGEGDGSGHHADQGDRAPQVAVGVEGRPQEQDAGHNAQHQFREDVAEYVEQGAIDLGSHRVFSSPALRPTPTPLTTGGEGLRAPLAPRGRGVGGEGGTAASGCAANEAACCRTAVSDRSCAVAAMWATTPMSRSTVLSTACGYR